MALKRAPGRSILLAESPRPAPDSKTPVDPLPPIDRAPPVARAAQPPAPPSPPLRALLEAALSREHGGAAHHGPVGAGGPGGSQPSAGVLVQVLEGYSEVLRRSLGEGRPLGELFANLLRRLAERVARAAEGPERDAAGALLAEFVAHLVGSDLDGPGLAARAAASGLFDEAQLALTPDGDTPPLGLKAQLLNLLAQLAPGPERDAASALLLGIEREQWLELLRVDLSEPRLLALPFAHGEHFGTLFLGWAREGGDGQPGGEGGRRQDRRLSLSLELATLGPMRADLVFAAERLLVRLAFASPTALDLARAQADHLAARLAACGGARALEVQLEFALLSADGPSRGHSDGREPHALEEVA